jgi:hypothetical protein
MNAVLNKCRIILGLLLLPILFINVKDTHDWGDDFAQYLIQARNIVEDRPQTDNGLLFSEKDPAYAIEAYLIGFPLLIAPIYSTYKLNVYPYNIFNSLILFCLGFICFEFFRKRTNLFLSILIALLFCYNPQTIYLKKQILSEIAFSAFFLFTFLWSESKYYHKKYSWIATGIILCLLTSIRLAGIAALAGLFVFELFKFIKTKEKEISYIRIKYLFLSFLSFIVFFFLLNGILFPVQIGNLFGFYSNAFGRYDLQLLENLRFYFDISKYLLPFFGKWIPSIWIVLALAGWIIHLIKYKSLADYIFPFYILIILFYPYSNAGLRFLIPIFPLLLFYFGYLIYFSLNSFFKYSEVVIALLFLIFLSGYVNPLIGYIHQQSIVEEGPETEASKELFKFLKTTDTTSAVVFCKARAMSLYSERSSLYTAKDQTNAETYNQFQRYHPLYLVIANVKPNHEIYDRKLLNYISNYKDKYQRVWHNDKFNVYLQKQ